MVGASGFEPPISWSRTRRFTGLSYAPLSELMLPPQNAPRRTRTSNLLIRSQMLYPIELWAQKKQLVSFQLVRSLSALVTS